MKHWEKIAAGTKALETMTWIKDENRKLEEKENRIRIPKNRKVRHATKPVYKQQTNKRRGT
jgi:hypothetical protein